MSATKTIQTWRDETLDRMKELNLLDTVNFRASKINSMFINAVDDGDVQKIEEYLREGADVNINDSWALIMACNQNQADVVRKLLEWGARENARNSEPMSVAVRRGSLDVVKALLDHDASIDAEIVGLVATYGCVDIMEEFFEREYHIPESEDILKISLNRNDVDMIELYLDYDMYLSNSQLLYWVVLNDEQDLLNTLIEKDHIDMFCDGAHFAMENFIVEDKVDKVRYFLDNGYTWKIPEEGHWALCFSVVNGRTKMVRELLWYGLIDIHDQNEQALFLAVQEGYIDLVELLLDYGADGFLRNHEMLTLAVNSASWRIARILVYRCF